MTMSLTSIHTDTSGTCVRCDGRLARRVVSPVMGVDSLSLWERAGKRGEVTPSPRERRPGSGTAPSCVFPRRRSFSSCVMLMVVLTIPCVAFAQSQVEPVGGTGVPPVTPSSRLAVKPGIEVGRVWTYSISVDSLSKRDVEGALELGRTVQTAHVRMEATHAEEDGSVVVVGQFDRLTSMWRRGDTQFEFTWVRPEGDGKAPRQQAEDEPKPEKLAEGVHVLTKLDENINAPQPRTKLTDAKVYQQAYESFVSKPFQIVLSHEGTIESVSGAWESVRALAEPDGLDASALGMFLPSPWADALAPIWNADGAAAIEQVGDTWTEKRETSLSSAGRIELTTTWAAKSANEQRLIGAGVVAAQFTGPAITSAAQPRVDIKRFDGSASMQWSLKEQSLISRVERMELTIAWVIGDIEAMLTQHATRRLNRID